MTVAPRFDLTSLGEVMMRLSVGQGQRVVTAEQFDAYLGGAESNVCAALAGLGRRTAWFGVLPDSHLGEWVLRRLRATGMNVDNVRLAPNSRLGTYFVELGAAPNPIDVIYDRAGSAAANMTPDDIAWEAVLDTRWLHLTGITPALGEGPAVTVEEALRRAAARGVKVSLDVNFRSKLWTADKARAWLEPRLELVDLLICGIQDAGVMFGLRDTPEQVARRLADRTRSGQAVVTLGEDGAVAWGGGGLERTEGVSAQVIDRLGAGDAFAAGVIDAFLDSALEYPLAHALQRGVALGAAALGQRGDVVNVDRELLRRVVNGGDSRPER